LIETSLFGGSRVSGRIDLLAIVGNGNGNENGNGEVVISWLSIVGDDNRQVWKGFLMENVHIERKTYSRVERYYTESEEG
jgi:hypothetical protein